jgi:Arc/MetJ-type ribon-helix-helix transcriptional regulator
MGLTSIRLPEHLTRQIEELARTRHTTRSEIVREAVATYCAASADQPGDRLDLLRQLVTYEGSGTGDRGARGEAYLREMFRDRRRDRTR